MYFHSPLKHFSLIIILDFLFILIFDMFCLFGYFFFEMNNFWGLCEWFYFVGLLVCFQLTKSETEICLCLVNMCGFYILILSFNVALKIRLNGRKFGQLVGNHEKFKICSTST